MKRLALVVPPPDNSGFHPAAQYSLVHQIIALRVFLFIIVLVFIVLIVWLLTRRK